MVAATARHSCDRAPCWIALASGVVVGRPDEPRGRDDSGAEAGSHPGRTRPARPYYRQPSAARAAPAGLDGPARELWRRKGWQAAVCVPLTGSPSKPVSWDLHLNQKTTRFSRSEGSSGRIYKCMDGPRGGTAHHLPVLLAKVNRPRSPCYRDARGLKAQITGWPHTQAGSSDKKRWKRPEAPSPATAAATLSSTLCTNARRRGDRGSRANPTAEKKNPSRASEAP